MGFDSRLFLEQRHVGVLFLLVRDGSVGPFVVGSVGHVSDHGGVETFFAHGFGEVVHDERAIAGVGERFNVIVHVGQAGTLVRDDDDASFFGLLENGLKGFGVNRNDADSVNTLRDEVLHKLGLLGGIDDVSALLIDVQPSFCGVFLDAGVHTDEPGVRGILRDDDNLVILVGLCSFCFGFFGLCSRGTCTSCQTQEHRQRQEQCEDLFHLNEPSFPFLVL